MRDRIRTALLAMALALAGVGPLLLPDVAQAQSYNSRHNYRYFHRVLARYGDWVYSDRWGEVWIPDVGGDFRPYRTEGYWVNTRQYGWFWRSSYPWGDITFHYGRWVNDPYDGWLWIPGYVWSPGWVVWRGSSRYVGWMPMPPDRDFLQGNEASFGISISGRGFSLRFGQDRDFYGYSSWYGRDYDQDRFASNWTFVGTAHLADRDYRPYVVNQTNVVNVINATTNITNYTVVNNYVVNRSVDPRVVARASGQPVPTVQAATVIKDPTLVTRVDDARRAQQQAPQPIMRGTGQANSAPQPTAAVVSTLSDRPIERNGRPASRLFNRQTVTTAPLAPRAPEAGGASTQAPAGAPAATPAPMPPTRTPGKPTPQQNAPAATPPVANNPAAETGGRNRGRGRGEQGGANNPTPPPQNAPEAAPAPENNAPAETGGRNRGRGRGEQGGANNPTPPPQNAPEAAPAPENNPPAEMGGRNRRGRGEQGGGANNPTPSPQNAPTAAPVPENNAPAETGGRNRGRGRGDQGGANNPTPPPQNAPAAAPAPENNPPAETGGRNRERVRGGRGEQGTGTNQGGGDTAGPQNAPAASPTSANPPAPNATAPDNSNADRHKKKGKKDNSDNSDNQVPSQAPPN